MFKAEKRTPPQKVLIASANPLFGRGLERLITRRWGDGHIQIRLASEMSETLSILTEWGPDLVIVDYDDRNINRAEFLSHFVAGEKPMQVMMVSLQASGAVVVYDRRTLTPAQAEDWLDLQWLSPQTAEMDHSMPKRSSNMKHFVIVGVLVVVLTLVVNAILTGIGILPVEAATQAAVIDRLFNLHFFFIAFLFSLIAVFLMYSVVVWRKKAGGPDEGANFSGSNRLEIAWTVFPLAAVLVVSYLGSVALADIQKEDPDALEVQVTAGQWFWSFEYPEFGITSSSLYLPVNRQVLLRMSSVDVIHSFWVPEFRVKQDVLPGENFVRELRFTPSMTGEFTVRCAELCGGAHAYMNSPVIVMEPTAFDQWLQDESGVTVSDPAARGLSVVKQTGCVACHTIDGSNSVGPTWQGLFGKEETLVDGSTVVVDETYLHTAIVNPNAQVPEGYPPNVMPQNYEQLLDEQDIADIIEYIKSIQ